MQEAGVYELGTVPALSVNCARSLVGGSRTCPSSFTCGFELRPCSVSEPEATSPIFIYALSVRVCHEHGELQILPSECIVETAAEFRIGGAYYLTVVSSNLSVSVIIIINDVTGTYALILLEILRDILIMLVDAEHLDHVE